MRAVQSEETGRVTAFGGEGKGASRKAKASEPPSLPPIDEAWPPPPFFAQQLLHSFQSTHKFSLHSNSKTGRKRKKKKKKLSPFLFLSSQRDPVIEHTVNFEQPRVKRRAVKRGTFQIVRLQEMETKEA